MRVLIAALVVVFASGVSAQRVERVIDLSAMGWGNISADPIDSDGDPLTEEWLIRKLDAVPNKFRVVSVRGELCAGEWFTAAAGAPVFVSYERVTIGGRTKLRVGTWPVFSVVSLDTPTC